MTMKDKVINAIQMCLRMNCKECPYYDQYKKCTDRLKEETLKVLMGEIEKDVIEVEHE